MNREWLAGVIAIVVVRRLVYLTVAVLIGLLASMCDAKAAQCGVSGDTCDRGEAHALAQQSYESINLPCKRSPQPEERLDPDRAGGVVWINYVWNNGSCDSGFASTAKTPEFVFVACPAGKPWDPQTRTCFGGCASKPDIGPVSYAGLDGGAVCKGGCEYATSIYGFRRIGGKSFSTSMGATGQSCTTDTDTGPYDPNRDVCQSTGGAYAECVKPNGDHCLTSPRGTSLCWKPGETGPRQTTDGKDGGDRKVAPQQPMPPPNQQNPQQQAPTSNTTINNISYNTGGYSGAGAGAGQGNTGSGGKDAGGTGGSGTGAGNGSGSGDGNNDPGSVGAGMGTLYEKSGETVESVMGGFMASAQEAPVVAATSAFFAMPAGGGSCPVWTLAATQWNPQLSFDLCSPGLATLLNLAGYVLLAVAAYAAFRICID